jgi:hypothetical protein
MKSIQRVSIINAVLLLLIMISYAQAAAIEFDRAEAQKYASEHCGTGTPPDVGYNSDYKCWNGTLKGCENYQDKNGDGIGDGPKTDCANFVSQSLIDGGFDFNGFNYKKDGAVTIGKKGTEKAGKKGFPGVRDKYDKKGN